MTGKGKCIGPLNQSHSSRRLQRMTVRASAGSRPGSSSGNPPKRRARHLLNLGKVASPLGRRPTSFPSCHLSPFRRVPNDAQEQLQQTLELQLEPETPCVRDLAPYPPNQNQNRDENLAQVPPTAAESTHTRSLHRFLHILLLLLCLFLHFLVPRRQRYQQPQVTYPPRLRYPPKWRDRRRAAILPDPAVRTPRA